MDHIEQLPVSADVRTWDPIIPNKKRRRRLRRSLGGVWFAKRYMGISDDVLEYLRNPQYLCFRKGGDSLAVMVCGHDTPGALEILKPCKHLSMDFYHIWVPMAYVGAFKTGNRNHMVFKKAIAHEPHILVEDAFNY